MKGNFGDVLLSVPRETITYLGEQEGQKCQKGKLRLSELPDLWMPVLSDLVFGVLQRLSTPVWNSQTQLLETNLQIWIV
jgi:hypothetical protein